MPYPAKLKSRERDDPLDLYESINKYLTEISRQRLKITELETMLILYQIEIQKRRGIHRLSKDLYRALDNKVMQVINKRGYNVKKDTSTVKLPRAYLSGQSRDRLLKIARQHDAIKYFRYTSSQSNMKLHYRILAKAYRTTRGVVEEGLKRTVRLTKRSGRKYAN